MEKRRRGGVSSSSVLVLAVLLATAAMPPPRVAAGLSPDYYKDSCPDLESIVRYEVTRKKNETVVTIPATLRLVFHDCMAGGGAAVLIASKNNDAQKDAPDNESLAGDGFDTINRVKAAVEKKCPGVVSCADIIALAARDVVYLADGPEWPVELGRLDALTSRASDVKGKLPDPDMDVNGLMQVFQRKGFSKVDMVALSGAHTVGFAHCSRFTNRLYGYGGGGGSGTDPSFNPDYADQLKEACPVNVGATIAVNMDPVSPVKFDNTYYINLQNRLGLFASDQVLYTDETTRPIVDKFAASQKEFFDAFVAAMLKLGRIGVKTGKEGEIRRVCTAFNH